MDRFEYEQMRREERVAFHSWLASRVFWTSLVLATAILVTKLAFLLGTQFAAETCVLDPKSTACIEMLSDAFRNKYGI